MVVGWGVGLGVGRQETQCLTHLRVLIDRGGVLLLDEEGVALGHGVLSCCGPLFPLRMLLCPDGYLRVEVVWTIRTQIGIPTLYVRSYEYQDPRVQRPSTTYGF